jgi:hypothetical protein
MGKIEVFEPALCCATGVCGEDVDQSLVTFSADSHWLSHRIRDCPIRANSHQALRLVPSFHPRLVASS